MIGRRTITFFAIGMIGILYLIACFQITRPSDPVEITTRGYVTLRNTTSMPGISLENTQKNLERWIEEYVDIEHVAYRIIGPSFYDWVKDDKTQALDLIKHFLSRRFFSLMPMLATSEMKQQSINQESYTSTKILIRIRQPGTYWTDLDLRLNINIFSWKITDIYIESQSVVDDIHKEIGYSKTVNEFREKISPKNKSATQI